jgi:heat shock protein HtpX
MMEERSISVDTETYERIALLRARLSARRKEALTWNEFVRVLLARERRKNEAVCWLYTVGIFLAITVVLLWPVYIYAPRFIPLVFLVGIVFAAVWAYVLSPHSARMMKPFKDAPPEIVEWLEELAQKSELKRTPVLRVAETPEINAMAYSGFPRSSVCLTRGLVDAYAAGRLPQDEVRAIIGHEIGHLRNRDHLQDGLARSWVSVFGYFGDESMRIGIRMARLGAVLEAATDKRSQTEEERKVSELVPMLLSFSGWFSYILGSIAKLLARVAWTLAFHLSRRQEYAADDVAAELTRPGNMASALATIHALNSELDAKALAKLPLADRWQAQPRNQTWVDGLWDTHPPAERRVARQQAVAQVLQEGP